MKEKVRLAWRFSFTVIPEEQLPGFHEYHNRKIAEHLRRAEDENSGIFSGIYNEMMVSHHIRCTANNPGVYAEMW